MAFSIRLSISAAKAEFVALHHYPDLHMARLSTLVLALLVGCFTLVDSAAAQMMPSERSQLHQKINGVEVVIDYSRPSVRGRLPIWGGIEHWDILWTPGANSSTTFKFSEDVTLNGTDIAAGKYSVWFELLENDPWNLVLFTDTTMFHVPYPSKDSSLVAIEIEHKEVSEFVETLRFDIENVRVDGADIEFRWGNTMVPIRLGIDPGYDMVFSGEEAMPYVGSWLLDTSMERPADSLAAKWREETSEDRLEDLEKWLSSFDAPHEISLAFDDSTGLLKGHNKTMEQLFGEDDYMAHFILVRKGEGIFNMGSLQDGELFFVDEYTMWEFDFDENGWADLLQQRARNDDRLMGRAERAEE